MESFKTRLAKLQEEMKAPKNLYNSFGKYHYRNAEGILEAAKPLLVKYKMVLNITDEVVLIGDRYYLKATARVSDTESDESIQSAALAREALDKKGQDDSQITGTASSYARKYALNGLFLLDDTKDADTDEYHTQSDQPGNHAATNEEQEFNRKAEQELSELASEPQKKAINAICKKHKVNISDLCALNGFTEATMTKKQATLLISSLKNKFGDE